MSNIINLCINPRGIGGTEGFSRVLQSNFPDVRNCSFGLARTPIFDTPVDLIRRKEISTLKILARRYILRRREVSLPALQRSRGRIVIFNAPCDFDHFPSEFFEGNKVLFVAHNAPEHVDSHRNYFGKNRSSRIEKLAYMRKFLCLSDDYKSVFKSLYRLKESQMDSFFHTTELTPNSKAKNFIRSVGTICRIDNKAKRLDRFLSVADVMPETAFIIFGGGPDEDWLKIEVSKRPNVNFLGVTNNIPKSLSEIGVFLVTSDYEGFPISIVEALSQSVPIIIGKNSFSNARVIVKDGVNGFVDEEFDPKSTRKLIHTVFSDYDFYSRGALESFSIFNQGAFRAKWNEIFGSLH